MGWGDRKWVPIYKRVQNRKEKNSTQELRGDIKKEGGFSVINGTGACDYLDIRKKDRVIEDG